MRLRILHVIPRLEWGSAEWQIPAIARGCGSQFDLHVATCAVTDGFRGQLQRGQATLHVLPSSRLWTGPALARWHSLIRALQPDIVHCWRLRQTWPIAMWTATCTKAQLVVDLRLPDGSSEWLNQQGQRTAARIAKARVVPCEITDRATPWGPSTVVPDQVDDSFLETNPVSRHGGSTLRSELGLGDSAKIILCVGRLLLRKNMEELIWSAELMKVVRNDGYLAILGDGPDRERLQQFRDEVEIRDHVRFLGARYDVPQCMREAHCLWTASDEEDYPLAIAEAQAIGLPIVASDIPAHRQWIQADRTGILIPRADSSARVRETIRLLDDANLAESLAHEAKLRFQLKRDAERDTMRYSELYENLASC